MTNLDQLHYLANGYRHIALGEVGSTNQIALEYSKRSDPGKLWVSAQSQSGGKGSRGRSWVSAKGNLFASLLLHMNVAPQKLATLSFVAGLAVFEALKQFFDERRLTLKWPNDVLLDGKKVSGILLENHVGKNRRSAVIIGVGINCNSSPLSTAFAATNMAKEGQALKPETVFGHLVAEMDRWLEIWDNGANFMAIRNRWIERAAGRGEKILVKMPDRQIAGIFEDIDNDGCLILKSDDGLRQTISVADIFFQCADFQAH